ncbi:helix-turn-helix domain-containing protein [Sedimentibacter sp.]|uniref:helix-turn-helix domain-containing protein n=1 Tax=Sedimentibacter sp. TaxID=1960295 RepID=UPI002897E691|nr:helix-turn-helix domain-containing protein [Sedimentibacter sp.]
MKNIINNNEEIVFNISDVAKIVGVVPATVRNWEKAGLIQPKRKGNNYRVYNFSDIEILKKIKEYADENNMSLSLIKQLLSKDVSYSKEKSVYDKEFYHAKLKKYREDEGYTLEEVSSAVGISPSYLSRIENGKTGVTYEILDKLAAFYGESTLRFFDIKNNEDSEVIRSGTGKKLLTGLKGVTIESLINSENGSFESVKFIIEPHGGDFNSHNHHSGEEFIYVLKGRLNITLDDATEFTIAEGDSIHFKSNRMHKWHNPTDNIIEILWVHSYLG